MSYQWVSSRLAGRGQGGSRVHLGDSGLRYRSGEAGGDRRRGRVRGHDAGWT